MRYFARVDNDWSAALADLGLHDPLNLLAAAPADQRWRGEWQALTKPGLGGRERWRWQLPDSAATLYLKRYQHTPWREQVDRMIRQRARHSRAWWEYEQSRELARQYVPAVRAVAVAEAMRGWRERSGSVLFEEVPGDAFDRAWPRLEAQRALITRGPLRHDLIRRLARYVSAFHQSGACHRDLYLCHIFTVLDPDGVEPARFWLIDLARLHRPRWRRTRWLIKDLSQLDTSARQIGATRTDRLRFLLAYLGLERGAPRARWYARKIVRKSSRILRRIARKSRKT